MDDSAPSSQNVDALHQKLSQEAEEGGYHLNPDAEFAKDLVESLITNEQRYGYWACPCRLASGEKDEDIDIICPCDYRDADLTEHDMCYCALYVSGAVARGEKELTGSIPERRLPAKERKDARVKPKATDVSDLPLPVWRCKVCGYLCAREDPPEVCPVCKAKKDRFERFL
jgi:ferredoxin-thioredoxin reductase catalytic subunit